MPDIALLSGEDGSFVLPSVKVAGTYRVGASAPGMHGETAVIVDAEDSILEVMIAIDVSQP